VSAPRELPVRFPAGKTGPERDLALVGTLRLPAGPGPHPAALLLPGSGPLDRDGNHRRLAIAVSRQLADALAAAGLASLRYDRRGVGASGGSFLATGFHDNVDDAGAALDTLGARPEVDAGGLFLVGHSEGALTAIALAGRAAASSGQEAGRPGQEADPPGRAAAGGGPTVAGLVLLAPTARPGEEVLRWQATRLLPTLPRSVRALLRLTRTDLVAKVHRNHARVRATTTDVARIGLVRLNARWHREFMDYDPRDDLARIRVPVLALTGAKDLQVDPADLAELARVAGGPVETHVLPEVSHILRRQPGPASLKAYRSEVRRPVDAGVTRLVVEWLCRKAGRPPIT
jgi:pimeloyl-ACP methyl ester carboxylesterase